MTPSISARFSAAAETYDRHASVQEAVAARVADLLAGIPTPHRVLEIGCGTGILTEKLVRLFPAAAITASDLSPGMIERCRTRLGQTSTVNWSVGDIRDLSANQPFDLTTSSSALHWIDPIDAAFRAVAALTGPGAHFVFAVMLEGTLSELHAARRNVAPHKPVRAALPSADTVLTALTAAGFRLVSHERHGVRARFESCSELLAALHEQGLTGGPVSSSGVPLTRTELKELASRYDSHYKMSSGGVYASYDCLFAVAQNSTPVSSGRPGRNKGTETK